MANDKKIKPVTPQMSAAALKKMNLSMSCLKQFMNGIIEKM